MKTLASLPLVVAACVSGCASVSVDVRILNQDYWSSPERQAATIQNDIANFYSRRGNGEFLAQRDTIKLNTRQVIEKLVTVCGEAKGCIDRNDIPKLVAPVERKIDQVFAAADHDLLAAVSNQHLASAGTGDSALRAQAAAQQDLARAKNRLSELSTELTRQFANYVQQAELTKPRGLEVAAVAQAKSDAAQVQNDLQGIIGNQNILGDPRASAVVYAPERFWTRDVRPFGVNDTAASGKFGNTDIAIKMNSVGDFTIKGVRLDATKITQATFAVGRQAIKTVAALYGVPMPPSKAGTATTTSTTSTATTFSEVDVDLASPDQRRDLAALKLRDRRLARINIVEAVLAEAPMLTNAAADATVTANRKAAAQSLKTTFDAYKGRLGSEAATN